MFLKKNGFFSLVIVCMLTLIYATGWSSRQLETESIHLRGSSTVAPIAQQVAEMYMQENPGATVTVTSIGTLRGIKSLIDATCNIAMASADTDAQLEKHAKDNDVTLIKHVIAHDALIPIVHPSNGITNLTIEELRKLFSGEITNWQQLGGVNQPVIIASYSGSSGNYETWRETVMKEGKVVTAAAKILSSTAMTKFIQQTPGAIGYVSLPYLDNSVKVLTVEGINFEVGNIINNTYPIARELTLYTTKDSTASVNKFIEYFLKADKGQQFVKKANVIPVK